jgi:photosystem II stability/assembly factor-like uncharacterized protein/C1A family cysteine protease
MFTKNCWIFILVLGLCLNLFAKLKIEKAPLNPEFIKYQKLSREKQKAMGYIPPPFRSRSAIPRDFTFGALPVMFKVYCLTAVDDQEQNPTCYAHAATAAVEQLICQKKGEKIDLSEQCMHAYLDSIYDASLEGGNTETVSSYFYDRVGPVEEGEGHCKDGIFHTPIKLEGYSIDSFDEFIKASGPSGYPYSKRLNKNSLKNHSKLFNQRDTVCNIIKKIIYEKGPVVTSLFFGSSFYDKVNYTYFCDNTDTVVNHSVLLAGWDDSLQTAADKPGAWIAKNSWGTAFGDSGYFYLSYYDSLALTYDNACWTELGNFAPNEHLYKHDQLGRVSALGYDHTDKGYGLAKFEAINEVPVTEILTWTTMGDAYVSIWVYDDFDGSSLTGLISQSLNNYREFSGYTMYELPAPIYFPEGDDFYVKVEYRNPEVNSFPIPSECYIEGYCDPVIQTGKYWVSSDGNNWYGIGIGSQNPDNLSIRAYAEPVKPIWRKLSSGTNSNLWGVYFTGPNTGYVVGSEGIILKTINAGETWFPLSSGTNNSLSSVYFVNENTGWIVGHYGTILKTTNAGETWSSQSSGTGNWLGDVYFTDENHGFIVGLNGIILRTSNGGNSWETLASSTNQRLYSVRFKDQNTGWAAGWHGTLIKTEDGGDSWSAISCGTGEDISTLCFTSTNTAWAAADNGTVLKSTDGGESWNPQPSPAFLNLYTVGFCNQNTGWMLGDKGSILKTNDGGESWEFEASGTKNLLFAAHFPDQNIGYAVGMGGTIITNKDSATVAVKETIPLPTGYALYQNYPNPFNAQTSIQFCLPSACNVRIDVFNPIGQRITTLLNSHKTAGYHRIDFDGSNLPSGIYYYKLQTDKFQASRKMMLVK